jgi:hypothetical protein
MKKHIITIFFLLALILSACGSTARAASSAELPMATKLIVGTLKLEGTQQAITAAEARQLLPLWQVYSEMVTSDTAAQEEIDGLVEQIQETMTSEQAQAINDMGLTQRDIFAVMQNGSETRSQMGSNDSTPGGGGGGFGPGGGGPPPGGEMMMGGGPQGQNPLSSQNSTNSDDSQSDQSSMFTSRLLETLISFLEKKAQQ